ncbi:MAG: DUF192 domain-containing protein, partial [Gaiellaceae bacterium]
MTDAPAPPSSSPARRQLPVPGKRMLQWVVVVLLVAGGVAVLTKGADNPPDPHLVATREPLTGFGEIAYRINRTPDATRCALLAQTALQQAQGLMGQTSLGAYDGMLFAFPADTTTTFYMKDTP